MEQVIISLEYYEKLKRLAEAYESDKQFMFYSRLKGNCYAYPTSQEEVMKVYADELKHITKERDEAVAELQAIKRKKWWQF